MYRVLVLSSVALVLTLAVCTRVVPLQPSGDSPQPGYPLRVQAEESEGEQTLSQILAAQERAYRLAPDRRLLGALGDVAKLLGDTGAPAVSASFEEGRWTIRIDGKEAGVLSRDFDFEEASALLQGVASARLQQNDPMQREAREVVLGPVHGLLLADVALARLAEVDARWSSRPDDAELAEASALLTSLALQLRDSMEVGDAVPARAWATVAVARARKLPVEAHEAALARALGYTRAARRLARQLDPADPVRAWVEEEDGRLLELAEGSDAEIVRWFALDRLADAGSREREDELRRRWFANPNRLPLLTARLERRDFGTNRLVGSALPVLVLAVLTEGPEAIVAPSPEQDPDGALLRLANALRMRLTVLRGGALGRFEKEIETQAQAGTFFDGPVRRAFYRALFYSGMDTLGRHLLDARADPETAGVFSWLSGTPDTTVGESFQRWYDLLVASAKNKGNDAEVFEAIAGLETFGGRPRVRLVKAIQERADWVDPVLTRSVRRLAPKLDTRPGHRTALAKLAWDPLKDLELSEALTASALAVGDYPLLEVWHAGLTGRFDDLSRLLADPSAPSKVRVAAMRTLHRNGALDAAGVAGHCGDLLREADDWKAFEPCVDLLEGDEAFAEARQLVESFLSRHSARDFPWIFARSRQAKLFQKEGKFERAWSAVEPAISSGQAGAMTRAARILAQLGRFEEAESLANRAATRYRAAHVQAALAEVLWRAGRFDDAAAALQVQRVKLRTDDWQRDVGAAFWDVFAARPIPEMLEAFDALDRVGVTAAELGELAQAATNRKLHPQAFEIQSRLKAQGGQGIQIALYAYRSLVEAQGAAEADAWVKKRLSGAPGGFVAMIAYGVGLFELAWTFDPDPPANPHGDYTWLTRAASHTLAPDPERAPVLRRHFEGAGGGTHYHRIGRYLMGLEDEAAMFALATDPKRSCEVAYFLGVKAEAAGDYRRAHAFYRASIETGKWSDGEYRWSHARLSNWLSSGKSLDRLVAERD